MFWGSLVSRKAIADSSIIYDLFCILVYSTCKPFQHNPNFLLPFLSSLLGMTLSSIRSFTLGLDGPADAAFTGGEVVSGQVVLELRRDTRVHSMKVQGRGVATAHWLENRGMNSVYNDYTSKITYFRKRQHLIRGQWWKLQTGSVTWAFYLSDWLGRVNYLIRVLLANNPIAILLSDVCHDVTFRWYKFLRFAY